MKKIAQAFTAATTASLIFAPLAFAEEKVITCPTTGPFGKLCTLSASDFGKLISQLVIIAFVGATVIALAFLIYGGFKWIVSGGEKTALEEARNHIVASIVGLVIIFLSFFILNLIIFFFTGQSLTTITFPTLGTL